jgi:hypothetical protein
MRLTCEKYLLLIFLQFIPILVVGFFLFDDNKQLHVTAKSNSYPNKKL